MPQLIEQAQRAPVLQREAVRTRGQDILFAALLVATCAMMVWRAHYGFPCEDEVMYLSVPQRIWNGDALFVEEWHLSQLFGLVLYPLYWLYRTLTGTTAGILLAFRLLSVAGRALVTLLMYLRLRHKGMRSVAAVSVYLLFTPLRIFALSYNTMGIAFVLLCGVVLATPERGLGKGRLMLCGYLFANAVLCTPSLALLYLLYTISVGCAAFARYKKRALSPFWQQYAAPAVWGWGTVGIAAPAAATLAFILHRAPLARILRVLPFLLQDPDHPVGEGIWLRKDILRIVRSFVPSRYSLAFYGLFILWGVLLLCVALDRHRKTHTLRWLLAGALLTAAFLILFGVQEMENDVMFPLSLLGILCYVLTERKNRGLLAFWLLGICYAMALNITSNLYFRAVSMGVSVSSVAGVLMAAELMDELRPQQIDVRHISVPARKIGMAVFCMLLLAQCGLETWDTVWLQFADAPTPTLTQTLQAGPAKGLCTSVQHAQNYEAQLADFDAFLAQQPSSAKNLLVPCYANWCYLEAEHAQYATFSAWVSQEGTQLGARLTSYFAENPRKIPDSIYVTKTSAWEKADLEQHAAQYGYSFRETDLSYQLTRQ